MEHPHKEPGQKQKTPQAEEAPTATGHAVAFSFSSAGAEQERSEVVSARQGPNGSVLGWLFLGSGRAGAMPPVILCFWPGSL